MDIKVLGTGCSRCHALYDEVEQAAKTLGLPVALSRVEKIDEIIRYGVMATPALVIDGKVKCAGRIPTAAELKSWLTTAAESGT